MWPIAIIGNLKPRAESTKATAVRLALFFEQLAKLDLLSCRWTRFNLQHRRSDLPAIIAMPPNEDELRSWIEENATFETPDGRKDQVGFEIRALTADDGAIRADFWVRMEPATWWFLNRTGITLFGEPLPEERVLKGLDSLLQSVLIALAKTWDCDWAGVKPGDFRWTKERPKNVPLLKYQSGWMIYLDPSVAPRITPPSGVSVERSEDGALLVKAVPSGLFNTRNPAHFAAALRIQTTLETLNEVRDTHEGL
jgi:hypothetical protein